MTKAAGSCNQTVSALCTEADTALAADGLLSLALTIKHGTQEVYGLSTQNKSGNSTKPRLMMESFLTAQAQIPPKATIAGGIGDHLTARTCQVILELSVFDSCLFTLKVTTLLPQTGSVSSFLNTLSQNAAAAGQTSSHGFPVVLTCVQAPATLPPRHASQFERHNRGSNRNKGRQNNSWGVSGIMQRPLFYR